MPNELKNALLASTNLNRTRKLPVDGSSSVSVMVWTVSGIVLASCGGGGGGGGGGLSVTTPSFFARVVDGPVMDATIYFDVTGGPEDTADGRVTQADRVHRDNVDENGDPLYRTNANGEVEVPSELANRFFVADVNGAIDTATNTRLSGEFMSLARGGVATPLTDLISRAGEHRAQTILTEIFGTTSVSAADIINIDNYRFYETSQRNSKADLILEAALTLTEIDNDQSGRFPGQGQTQDRISLLKAIIQDTATSSDEIYLANLVVVRTYTGQEIRNGTLPGVNDNRPEITVSGQQNKIIEGSISANTDTGFLISARDIDDPNGKPRLTVNDNRFRIDADGRLLFARDVEILYDPRTNGQFDVNITAEDTGVGTGPSPGNTLVAVTITPTNTDSGDARFTIISDGDINTPKPGDVLTASVMTPDPDGSNVTYSYQWYYVDTRFVVNPTYGFDRHIISETNQTYTVRRTDIGKMIGVLVTYDEETFKDDGITPTDTERVTTELATTTVTHQPTTGTVTDPLIAGVQNIRDIRSSFSFDGNGYGSASVEETHDILKIASLEAALRAYSGINTTLDALSATFGGAVVDSTDPHMATVTFNVSGQNDIVFTYVLSGDDADDFMLVQKGNDVSFLSLYSPDYERPADNDGMNNYSVAETITTISGQIPTAHRQVSRTYTLNVTDDTDDINIEIYENHPLYQPIKLHPDGLSGYQLTDNYGDNAFFTLDADGHLLWKVIPDYEAPLDGDGNNRYGIELIRTAGNEKLRVDITVKDLGLGVDPGNGYEPAVLFEPRDIPNAHLPSEFVQKLIYGFAWKMPKTGPLIMTYSISEVERADLAVYFSDAFPTDIYNARGQRQITREEREYDFLSEEERIEFSKTVTTDQAKVDNIYKILKAELLKFEAVANVKFVEVAYSEENIPHIDLSFGRYPGRNTGVSIHTDGGDLNIGTEHLFSDFEFQRSIVHEIGHALALSHPFQPQGSALPPTSLTINPLLDWPGNRSERDSPLSVMSYNGTIDSLQQADIDALRFLYGAAGTDFAGVESIIVDI
jgi:hypothetical protein